MLRLKSSLILLVALVFYSFLFATSAEAYCGDGQCIGEDCDSCWDDCQVPLNCVEPPAGTTFDCGEGICPNTGQVYRIICDTHCGGGGVCVEEPRCNAAAPCPETCPGPEPISACEGTCTFYDKCGCAGGCWSMGCIDGQCKYKSGSACTPSPGQPPVPPPGSNLGTLLGEIIWDLNDLNCDGDHINDPGESEDANSRIIQVAGTNCSFPQAYTVPNGDVVVGYAGPQSSGGVSPHLCLPTGEPYYSVALPPGNYNVSLSVPGGWVALEPPRTVTVSTGQQTHVWFTMCGVAPLCKVTGPPTVQIGETANFSARADIPLNVGGTASVWLNRNSSPSGPLMNTGVGIVECSVNSCTTTYSFTPPAIGTYYIACRGWNDGIRECRPNTYTAPYANVDCDDPLNPAGVINNCRGANTDCMSITVTSPVGWFQTAGGDVHGGDIGTTIPTLCTGSCEPYLSLSK